MIIIRKKYFTDEQLEALLKNPYVKSASLKAVTYTEEFRAYFVAEYKAGKTPSEILRNSGFDVNALGQKRSKRVASCSARVSGKALKK